VASRYCLTPRCGMIVDGRSSYCDQHQPRREPWQGSKSRASTWEWKRMRRRILTRDGNRCVLCGAPATQVDAIKPGAEGGSHLEPSNLRSLCTDCHAAKTEEDRLRGLRRRYGR
jgi:5-methylcytosine-specific restriction endonuclease McrA